FGELAKGFRPKWDAVQAAALARPFGKPKELAAAAKDLAAWCEDFMRRQQSETAPVYSKEEAAKLLSLIGDAAVSKQWTADPEAAMHLTWGYVSLRTGMKNAVPKDKLDALGKVIPVQVREEPYSTKDGNPRTVGETFRARMDLFRLYDSKNFSTAFGDVLGKK